MKTKQEKNAKKRFLSITEKSTSAFTVPTIIVDKTTGVQYLFVVQGYSGGLAPLIDKDGKPLLYTSENEEE
jgi:hypothetical protein